MVAALQRLALTMPHEEARLQMLQDIKFQRFVVAIENCLQHAPHSFEEQDLANLVWSAAKLQLLRVPIFELVHNQVVGEQGQSRQYNNQQLAAIAWAYIQVGFPAPHLFDAVYFRARCTPELAELLCNLGILGRISDLSSLGPKDEDPQIQAIQHLPTSQPTHPYASPRSAAVGDATGSVMISEKVPTAGASEGQQQQDNNQIMLADMGFLDQMENLQVLTMLGNDMEQAIDELMRRKFFREQQQQNSQSTPAQQQQQRAAAQAPAQSNMQRAGKLVGYKNGGSSVQASNKTAKVPYAKANGSSIIPWDQTLVIKGVPRDKQGVIADALKTKTSHIVAHFSNPSFVDDLFGPGLLCYTNYKSKEACVEAVAIMKGWFTKRDWGRGVFVHVKK
mmetsp:Transcript_28536/g.45827  ORF Transcript_28536/g.45827 Transcript_28536/m.45827 type:complete len:392 (+) Transcript_28536:306-1481(+)